MNCNVMRSLPVLPGLKSVNANTNAYINSIKGKSLKGYGFTLTVRIAEETDDGVFSYVLIELITGRHHQIRAQMSNLGCGIWGDTKYNPLFAKTKKKYTQIGLYSSRIELEHPVTGKHMVFKSEPEGEAFDIIELDEF